MPAKKKPFRTIRDSHKTGRFTREEVREAVLAVVKERGEFPASGSARPEGTEVVGHFPAGAETRTRRMQAVGEGRSVPMKKKPFRKILPPAHPPTHFTVEEARRAVREVMEEDRLAEEALKRGRPRKPGDRSAA